MPRARCPLKAACHIDAPPVQALLYQEVHQDSPGWSLEDGYEKRLSECTGRIWKLREKLSSLGWILSGQEALKITVDTAKCGYDGREFAQILRAGGVECEYADPDFVVFMFTTENGEDDLKRLLSCFENLAVREAISQFPNSSSTFRKTFFISVLKISVCKVKRL